MFITYGKTPLELSHNHGARFWLHFCLALSLPDKNTMATDAEGAHVNLYVEMETTGNEFWQVLLWNIIFVVAAVAVYLSVF